MNILIYRNDEAKKELNKIVDNDFNTSNTTLNVGYYCNKNKYISFWIAKDGEIFIEEFKNKVRAVNYAKGILTPLDNGLIV
jgi:adenine-specific DNA methylase